MRKISVFFLLCFTAFFQFLMADLPTLHVCTVASKATKNFRQLLHTCAFHQVEIDVLGMGLPYKGNYQKLIYVKEYLKDIPDDDLVLFVDGYDVLILSNKERMINLFLEMEAPCVFSAETNLFPKKRVRHLVDKFPKSPNRFKYLNSGSYMGYAWVLKKMLNSLKINPTLSTSDQAVIIPYFVEHQDEIKLDFNCKLFVASHKVPLSQYSLDYENRTVKCLITDSVPCVFHGNGHSLPVYQAIYNKLYPEGLPKEGEKS